MTGALTREIAVRAITIAVAGALDRGPSAVRRDLAETMRAQALNRARFAWPEAIRVDQDEPGAPLVTPPWWRGTWCDWPLGRLFAEAVLEGETLDDVPDDLEPDPEALHKLQAAFCAWAGATSGAALRGDEPAGEAA